MILPGIGAAIAAGAIQYPVERGTIQVTTDSGTPFAPTLPTHTAGDVLLVFCTSKGSSSPAASGWTKKAEIATGSADSDHQLTLFTKTAASSSETISITGLSGSTHAAHAYALANSNGSVEAATSATIDPPNLAPSWGATLTFWLVAAVSATAPASGPTGFTDGVQTDTGGAEGVLTTLDKEDSSASLNPAAFSSGGANPVTMTVAVRPAG